MAQRSVKVYQVDVFTETLFAGNPAGVVLGAEILTEAEMQALARELNNSDSAFVLPPTAEDHDLVLRFFTPKHEAGFVGHATVAAHVARLAAGLAGAGTLRQKSRSGIQPVTVSGSAENPHVAVTIPPPSCLPPISAEQKGELLDIFGIDTAALDPKCPILVTKRATTRLMIGLRSTELLASLEPDLEALKRMSLVSSDKSGGVRLMISPGSLRIVSESPDQGEGSEELDVDYAGTPLTLVVVLKGAAWFGADLARHLPHDTTVEFIRAKSYAGDRSTGTVAFSMLAEAPLAGRNVLVVEDILDTGRTLSAVVERLGAQRPNSLRVCTLLDKPARRALEISADYVGFTIPDRFVVGYGLDYNEAYRALPAIYTLSPE